MPDEETREEPEVEGHGVPPGDAAEGNAGGIPPGAAKTDEDADDVEAHMFGEGQTPGGQTPGGQTPGGQSGG